MTVESFDPGALNKTLNADTISQLLALADCDFEQALTVSAEDAEQLAFTARHDGWATQAGALDDQQLVQLAQFYTLAEQQLGGWRADDKSPVIALVRELKKRQRFDGQLRKWIKANTDNKFLPHGNLADLL